MKYNSLYTLFLALRKIDVNEDKLDLEYLISNFKIKGNLGFDMKIFIEKIPVLFYSRIEKREFLLYK